ncbi:unnamed protein product [Choristocarpus tenellus]
MGRQAFLLSSFGLFLGLLIVFLTGNEGWPGSTPVTGDDSSLVSTSAMSSELVDAATRITLPRTRRFSSTKDLFCLGVGVRAKSIAVVKVNVYTVGLYVDAKPAKGTLKNFKGKKPAKLSGDASLYKVLGQPGFTKYLHLIFARAVEAQKVVDALTAVKGVSSDVLSSFSSMLLGAIGDKIGKGESISLGWEGKDKMVVLVRDKAVGSIKDPSLPIAIFDLYLGSSAVSEVAKQAFAEGVSNLLLSS